MIKEIAFSDILPIWKANLWPNADQVKMRSAVHPDGTNDQDIHAFQAKFWGYYDGDALVGVISGFQTSSDAYRVRGLWVAADHANKGVGKALMLTTEQEARSWGCTKIWEVVKPAQTDSMAAFGYVVTGDFTPPAAQAAAGTTAVPALKVVTKTLA